MKQLSQKLKTGQIEIIEVPSPMTLPGHILVRNYYSLISAGTEVSSVITARKGYIGKAKEKPQQARQVIETLKNQGPVSTYRSVMKKLDAYSTLGYSCTGEVIDVPDGVREFKVGDLVACGGFAASHAEIVCVPVNLCVLLHSDSDLRQTVYNTLGAIALQGVRQADLRIGEFCAIIGMGLIGQITAQLLKISGIQTVGIDIDKEMINIGNQHCLDLGLGREDIGLGEKISEFTENYGCDATIITAATSSLDPINLAGAITRQKGTVVVVGAVPTGFNREPYYYKKELQVKMSCSYGPGRYDPNYEEKGVDYPLAYVRWTEKRNMQAFQNLIYTRKVDVSYLTTHIFKLDEAANAYEMMVKKSEPFIGILIEYNTKKVNRNNKIHIPRPVKTSNIKVINIGFIGAGSYAQSHLIPNIPKRSDINLKGVVTASGISSRSVAERFRFEFCSTDTNEIIENDKINAVFIATRHDSHGKYVKQALAANKHVFVEKPLCLNEKELLEIYEIYRSKVEAGYNLPLLMVGYNRRFSPLAIKMKKALGSGSMAMVYRINAGNIPPDSWIQDPDIGGGRIIGEACHFLDFLTFVNGSLPTSVFAYAMKDKSGLNDTVNISLCHANGSIGTICYCSNGDKSLSKERIEVFTNGCAAVLDDFKILTIHSKGRKKTSRLISQDKGQKNEVHDFIAAINNGGESPIPHNEIFNTSMVTFSTIESLRSGQRIEIDI